MQALLSPKALRLQVFWLIGRILSKINCKTQINYKRNHENGTEFAFRCNRGLSTTGSLIGGQWSDIDKMEWQAKTIAPKILMPRTAFKKKVDHIYRVLLADNPSADRSIVTE